MSLLQKILFIQIMLFEGIISLETLKTT